MIEFRIGDKVAAPVCVTNPDRKGARSRCGYDIGSVIATGKNKKSGKPAVKVRFTTADSVWAKRVTAEPFLEKWCLSADIDKI